MGMISLRSMAASPSAAASHTSLLNIPKTEPRRTWNGMLRQLYGYHMLNLLHAIDTRSSPSRTLSKAIFRLLPALWPITL